ncbi:MAG: cation:proton antiporter [Paramuribaculum sp.]|nr:cation:proton antiporter [Paramuribaculum sp.]
MLCRSPSICWLTARNSEPDRGMALVPAIHSSTPLLTSPVPIFLAVLLIILVTPIVLNKLRIPQVIGLIVAGVTVGPYGFNLLARDMSFEVFGQVGLFYLMFLAGIEIDMYHLKKNLRKGLVFGLYTFMIPLALGAVASGILLGLDALTAVLMASMFSAHTLIAYPIVSRFGLTRSAPVVIAIAGTIFTVLGSLIVLAGVVGTFHDGEFRISGTLKLLGLLAAYCIVLVYAYPRLTRWFFKHWNDSILQYVYVLAMMFTAAQLAIWAGIEGVFGAFFAGLVLNRYIPARSPLMSRIEFVGNAIFIPYFLIGVGMLINVGVVTRGWSTLYAAGVMSGVAMCTKWLAAFVTQRTFGMNSVERSMMYQLSNAHTAVALAVVMIGYGMRLFDEVILNGTVIMILVTCTVSSIGSSRAASRLKVMALEEEADDGSRAADHGRKRENVLIPVANPVTARELVDLALLMRDRGRANGKVYALHVRNDNSAASRSLGRVSLDTAEKAAASVDAGIEPIDRYDLNFVTGVVNTIEERDIDRVIIGLHRRTTIIDSFFGDKLPNLLRATNKMLVISRFFIPVNTIARIVVAVPANAQYETGFQAWVTALCNLASQLGCRLIFCCSDPTRRFVEAVIKRGQYEIRSEYRKVEDWDDFLMLSNKVLDDDLFVVVNARRASVSHAGYLDSMPEFLQKYFASNNMIVIYPEQFGERMEEMTMTDTLTTDIATVSSPLWLRVNSVYNRLVKLKKRVTQRGRRQKIDL